MYKIYEDIFDRVPLSLVRYNWFLENISTETRITYDVLKRIMDLVLSFVAGIVSLIFYPFVYILIKLDDGGSIYFEQERIGKNNKIIKIKKFRSMSQNGDNKITRVGKWLRALRIDELPQLWSVLVGDISMIGPRPEIPSLVKHYEEKFHIIIFATLLSPDFPVGPALPQRPAKSECRCRQNSSQTLLRPLLHQKSLFYA